MNGTITIENEVLRVILDPSIGGTISRIEHKFLGLSVLGNVPWRTLATPFDSLPVPDEATWLTRYTGGWPLLFPNGGDACNFNGRFHGFHGEASVAVWEAEADQSSVRLRHQFTTIPVQMVRKLSLEGQIVVIKEEVRSTEGQPILVMWGHHPTFGSDLLNGTFEIETGARMARVDQNFDPRANPLKPGAIAPWPSLPGKLGAIDVGRMATGPISSLVYLHDFDSHWVSIRRLDNAVAIVLSWDGDLFPYVWLWHELEGNPDPPWLGQTRLIGVEPNTTCSSSGIADAHRRGEHLLTLQPGIPVATWVRLNVFKPTGPIKYMDRDEYGVPTS